MEIRCSDLQFGRIKVELDDKTRREIIKWAAKKSDEAFEIYMILAERHRILFRRLEKLIYDMEKTVERIYNLVLRLENLVILLDEK